MRFICCLLTFLFLTRIAWGQSGPLNNFEKNGRWERLDNSSIKSQNVPSIIDELRGFKDYPLLDPRNRTTTYLYPDSVFGDLPVQVSLPAVYDPKQSYPLVLLLHGAVGHNSEDFQDDDIFYQFLKSKAVIIVRPRANVKRQFNWVVNNLKSAANPTFETLFHIVLKVKNQTHVDDSKMYVFGHSDGADGGMMLMLSKPGVFAGGILYNSMLTNIFETSVHLENLRNQPIYLVHSDLDDLRPIQQIDTIVSLLRQKGIAVNYKRYEGFKHYDQHLQKDLPYAWEFILSTSRPSYSKKISLEQSGLKYSRREWIEVDGLEPNELAQQVDPFLVPSYDKREKKFSKRPYYNITPYYNINAQYKDNIYTVQSKGVKAVRILIQNNMVDLNKIIKVIWNNKTVYEGLIGPNPALIWREFSNYGDAQQIYLNEIRIN